MSEHGRPRILHVLPHAGGGGEVVVDRLCEGLDGYEHRRLHLADARTPLRAAPSLVAGLARVRREASDADLLHVVGDTSALLCLPLLKRHRGVWGTHGLHLLRRLGGPAGAVARRRARGAIAAARATICSSRLELDELAALAGPGIAGRLVEVPNGIPLPAPASPELRARARAELGIAGGAVVALYLGELEQRKRPLIAVEAAELAALRGAPVVLLVAGEGPLAAEVAAREGSVVRSLGFRRDPERLLAAADILVMPSAREGLSLALLEALAHGLAVVASDGPGNPEAVGDAGVLHPVDDVDALAGALARLCADPDERARLGAAARARAEANFTIGRFLADMRRVFDAALADRSP